MGIRRSIFIDIVEHTIRNLKDSLTDYILVGSAKELRVSSTSLWRQLRECANARDEMVGRNVLNSKLEPLEALGELVDKLLLDGPLDVLDRHLDRSGSWCFQPGPK